MRCCLLVQSIGFRTKTPVKETFNMMANSNAMANKTLPESSRSECIQLSQATLVVAASCMLLRGNSDETRNDVHKHRPILPEPSHDHTALWSLNESLALPWLSLSRRPPSLSLRALHLRPCQSR